MRAQTVEPGIPEFLVPIQPLERALQRASLQLAAHHAANLLPCDEPRILEDREMLDEAGERHPERLGQRADRTLAVTEPREHGAPGRVGQRAEHGVETGR